jgi:uncharacterized protein (DUF2147 family)
MNLVLLLCLFLASFSPAVSPDDVLGTWLTAGDDPAQVSIYKLNGKYHGKITWLKFPTEDGKPRTDKNNPDALARNKPVIGLVIVKDFVWDGGAGKWNDGNVYDPKSGNTYSGYLHLESADRLKLRGYIGITLVGRTEYWTRVK